MTSRLRFRERAKCKPLNCIQASLNAALTRPLVSAPREQQAAAPVPAYHSVWWHPRPFMIGLGHSYLQHASDSSFPSDHATVFASVALTMLLHRLWSVGIATLFAGLVVAWARVFVGVHFPLDMAAAAEVACVSYALLAPLWNASGLWLTDRTVAIYRAGLAGPISRRWLRA